VGSPPNFAYFFIWISQLAECPLPSGIKATPGVDHIAGHTTDGVGKDKDADSGDMERIGAEACFVVWQGLFSGLWAAPCQSGTARVGVSGMDQWRHACAGCRGWS
jgi:hypothetical protein